MSISIVIPNFNGQDLLNKNFPKVLEAAKEFKSGALEIIIADDASTDSSLEVVNNFIAENKEIEIKLIKSHENKGFASNVNSGVQASFGEIVVLLNTDVAPHKNFLTPLIQHFKDETVFGVGCMDESIEDGKVVLRGRGVGKWRGGLLYHKAGDLEKDNTLWVAGGSGAFRKSYWDLLGGLDTIYNPFYWEDIDLCYRAIKSGFRCVFEKESKVKHEHEKGAVKQEYSDSEIKRTAYRNQFIFAWKNAGLPILITNLIMLPIYLVRGILTDRNLFIGILRAMKLAGKILVKRAIVNKQFRKNDKEALVGLTS